MNEKQRLPSRKPRVMTAGTRCSDNATHLYQQKLVLTSPTSDGQSVSELIGAECVFFVPVRGRGDP
jgi:hypothetical protein